MARSKQDYRILIVDDVEDMREISRNALVGAGFSRIEEAATVQELIDHLGRSAFDLVLLDIQLLKAPTVEDTLELAQARFPNVAFPHDAVVEESRMNVDDPVTGRYLLPLVKAVSADTEVIMLSGTWEGQSEEHFLRKWGSRITLEKATGSRSEIESELVENVNGLFQEWKRRE